MTNSETNLGQLESIDVRDIWLNEAGDFTPWLAKEENLSLLGDTIGIEMELEAQEQSVGPFRADILCKDTVDGNWVLIENQLEKTNHTHLGQLLTYAAGLRAVTIVWIADHFRNEHRAALDWLNEITDERFKFFGLEIEAWRINESPVAPKFNMVCKPNDWTKSNPIIDRDLTDTRRMQLDYWTAMGEYLTNTRSKLKIRTPRPKHWMNFALGRTKFRLGAAMDTQKGMIRTYVVCAGPEAKAHFHLLSRDQESIEAEVGEPLDWQELSQRIESRIEIHLTNADPSNRYDWSRQHKWLAERLEALYRAFSQRVKQIDAGDWDTEVDETME